MHKYIICLGNEALTCSSCKQKTDWQELLRVAHTSEI